MDVGIGTTVPSPYYKQVPVDDYNRLIRENEGLKNEVEEYKKAVNGLNVNIHKLNMQIIELKYKLKLYQPEGVTDE
jgi:hypothetical protein